MTDKTTPATTPVSTPAATGANPNVTRSRLVLEIASEMAGSAESTIVPAYVQPKVVLCWLTSDLTEAPVHSLLAFSIPSVMIATMNADPVCW